MECDALFTCTTFIIFHFNSRTHVECDLLPFVSFCDIINFNSRTHVECDNSRCCCTAVLVEFQLTHSRGVRLCINSGIVTVHNFNSRTHVECDFEAELALALDEDFNSRTHVECDFYPHLVFRYVVISTHALTWSATLEST